MNGEETARCEHFKLIREDPSYRAYLMLEELQVKIEPSLATNEDKPLPVQLPQPEWTLENWDYVQQTRAEVQGWRKKHDEILLETDKLKKLLREKGAYLYE